MSSMADRLLQAAARLEKQADTMKEAFQPMPGGQQMDQMTPEQAQQMGISPEEMGVDPSQMQQEMPFVGEMPLDQFAQVIQGIVAESVQQMLPQIQQMMMAMAPAEKGKGGQADMGPKLDQIIALLGGVLPSNGMPPGTQAGQMPPGGAMVPPMGGAPAGGQMQVSASAKEPKLADILAERVRSLRG